MEAIYRPSEMVRILNGTPLGVVISERQLYRHRQKAPQIHTGDKYVSLAKYCAWLILRRHKPQSDQSKRGHKKKRESAADRITLAQVRELLHQQSFRCALTGEKLTPTNFALDHIVPIARGGSFSIDNCQLVTKAVNRAKNTMGQDEFLAMCRDVVRYQASRVAPVLIQEDRPLLSLMS